MYYFFVFFGVCMVSFSGFAADFFACSDEEHSSSEENSGETNLYEIVNHQHDSCKRKTLKVCALVGAGATLYVLAQNDVFTKESIELATVCFLVCGVVFCLSRLFGISLGSYTCCSH